MTAQFLPSAPVPGEIVRVRQRQYLVEDVQPPPEPGEATLLSALLTKPAPRVVLPGQGVRFGDKETE